MAARGLTTTERASDAANHKPAPYITRFINERGTPPWDILDGLAREAERYPDPPPAGEAFRTRVARIRALLGEGLDRNDVAARIGIHPKSVMRAMRRVSDSHPRGKAA